MLRGTPNHPKIILLAELLGVTRYAACGIAELLWHFTGRFAQEGDVGRWTDAAIAQACFWEGDPAQLVGGLTKARLLDESDEHRLVVHDWHQHADAAVRKALHRAGKRFVTEGVVGRGRPQPVVYVLEDQQTKLLKIGHTEGELQTRIDTLQTGNPGQLVLLVAIPGTRSDESMLHRRFAELRVAGEWFEPAPALLAWVDAVRGLEKPAAKRVSGRSARQPKRGQRRPLSRQRQPQGGQRLPPAAASEPDIGCLPEPEPEPAPEPEPEPERSTTTTVRARPPVENSPATPVPGSPVWLATHAAASRLGRLVAQLEPVDPQLAAELDAAIEGAERPPTVAELEALADRALERLTAPADPPHPAATAGAGGSGR